MKGLFDDALARASEERALFLSEACRDDHALRAEVERLLTAHKHAGNFIDPLDSSSLQPFGTGDLLVQRYRLDAEVGRGGMGIIYRATDTELQREVAVKILSAPSSVHARERLLQEARNAAALKSPHIVTIHDIGEDRGCPFFVMELVAGPTLANVELRGLEEIVEVASQICDALDHAHAHDLVHRDLKPENVLLTGDRSSRMVKLADLGIAVPLRGARITETGMIVGTVAYMAPEQAMGEPVDGRTDLYSLGIMLYELTTGRSPFAGDHPLAIISQHVNAPVIPPRAIRSDLPPAFEAVILKLLEKSPAQRYATATDVREALRHALKARRSSDDQDTAEIAVLDALSRGRLVAREREFAEARELWCRARDGRSHCVLFSGEPGAGKTRLGRELIVQAALEGAVVITGACYEYEAATPYQPFAEAFRSWVRDERDAGLLNAVCRDIAPLLVKLAPEINTRLGPFPERPLLAPHEERLLFFDAVAEAFRRLSERRGLLVYVDDLHWADRSSLWLFGHLLRYLRNQRVLFAGAYRDVELDRTHELSKALVDWNRERLITRIVVRRLPPEGTREQLSALLSQELPADFTGAIHRETDGNPFFIEEILKALIEQGAVRLGHGRWTCSAVHDLQMPQSIKAAIGHRLDRVSAGGNDVLRAAAVLGKAFNFEELAAAADDRTENALLDAIDEAVAAQLLVASGESAFAFTHDKIREVLYEEMNPIRRRRLHLQAAEGLERCGQRMAIAVEKLAHHFIAAGDHSRGLTYAKEAGAEAERLFAYDEAIAAYQRALDCAEMLGRRDEQAALREAIGNAYIYSGDQLPAIGHFERALALATDSTHRARLQCRAASSLVARGDARGLDYIRQALAVLDPETHPLETANALSIKGRFHHLSGRHRQAIAHFERAAALISARSAAPEVRITGLAASIFTHVLAYLAGAYQHLGLFADSNVWAQRTVAFGVDHGVPLAQALGYEFLGENAIWTSDWDKGLAYVEREREIAARLHSRERQAWTHSVAGVCWRGRGDRTRAEREFTDGLALAELLGEQRVAVILAAEMAPLLMELGHADQALQMARQSLEWAEALGLLYMRTEARRSLADVHFRVGELDRALQLCDEVLELLAGMEPKVSRLAMGPLHVEALLAANRRDKAREILSRYESLVAECQSPRFAREASRLRVLLQDAGV